MEAGRVRSGVTQCPTPQRSQGTFGGAASSGGGLLCKQGGGRATVPTRSAQAASRMQPGHSR